MKGQLKTADRQNANYVLILGEDELAKNSVMIKTMDTGEQELVPMDEVVERIKK